MPLTGVRRRDAAALLLAAITAFAGITAWAVGDVDMGFQLGEDEEGFTRVVEVDPTSLAADQGIIPGQYILDLQRRDGSLAAKRLSSVPDTFNYQGDDPTARMRLVDEWTPVEEIDYISTFGVDPECPECWSSQGTFVRYSVTSRLAFAGVLVLLGAVLGVLAAAAVSAGWFGAALSGEGIVAGAAMATPLMALPMAFADLPAGTQVAATLAGIGMLPLAWSLSDASPEPTRRLWLKLAAVALVAVSLVALRRSLVYGSLATGGDFALMLAMVPLVPAVAAALAGERGFGDRIRVVALGGLPATAVLTHLGTNPQLWPLVVGVALMVGWQLVPGSIRERLRVGRLRTVSAAPIEEPDPVLYETPLTESRREIAALVVAGSTFVAGLATCCETSAVLFGAGFGVAVGFALRRGLLGAAWARAAIPIAGAVSVPIMALAFSDGGYTQAVVRLLLPALGALPVAHLLAWRHPDEAWRRTLFGLSVVLTAIVILLLLGSSYGGPLGGPSDFVDSEARLTIYLSLGFVALVPGLGAALAPADPRPHAPTGRLDLIAMGLTPGAAMTVLPGYSPQFWLFVAWLVVLVAWRRLTIAPLLGLAQRTQRQRDLAVAAVEAERARLAADLHDDALQELSALVRRLDAAGDAESAELARGVAERLRAITSDLRLPLLDDLGAGPALEWLVGRVRPLANGDVVLERFDAERPPANVELAFFRVAQEALANAVKHGASPISVRYRVAEDGGVSLSVDDAGPGIEPDAAEKALQAGHLGMANMQQRAQQIGALLDVRRWPTGGTHVRLEWRPR